MRQIDWHGEPAGDGAMPAVLARGLTHTYTQGQRRVTALDDVTVSLPAGSATAVVGPSGSGKSTLLHLLAGLARPAGGELRVAGQNLRALDQRALARFRNRDVGVVFQSFNLLPTLTVCENVLFPLYFGHVGRREGEERVRRLLDLFGLAEARDRRPAQLSGGEQQRVAIARALVTNPPIILADEPTGNLDEATGQGVATLLFRLARDFSKTLVLVTHQRRFAEQADRRIGIVGGRLVPEERVLCS